MTLNRQIEANRMNAKRNTGPKAAAGKERASGNALRHGLSNEGRSGDQTRLRRYRRAAFWSASCNRTYRLKRGAGAGSPGPFNPVAADTGRKDRNAPRQLLPDLPLAALPHPQGRLGRGHPRTRAKDVIDENATIDQQSSGCSQNEPNFTLHSLGL